MDQIQQILDSIFSIEPELKTVILKKWKTYSKQRKIDFLQYLKILQINESQILAQCIKNDPDFTSKLKNIEIKYKKEILSNMEKGETFADKEKMEKLLKQI